MLEFLVPPLPQSGMLVGMLRSDRSRGPARRFLATAALSPARAALGLALATLLACGGDSLTVPDQGTPSAIALVRGDRQDGAAGEPLGDSLVVRVTDRFGDPVGGVEVAWTPQSGGSVSPATSATSADGRAATQRMLGEALGPYVTTAALPASQGTPQPVVCTATGVDT